MGVQRCEGVLVDGDPGGVEAFARAGALLSWSGICAFGAVGVLTTMDGWAKWLGLDWLSGSRIGRRTGKVRLKCDEQGCCSAFIRFSPF